MNRSERRRAAREGYSPAPREALAQAVRDHLEKKAIRDEAILATSGPMLKAVYAAVILLMTEEYNFSQEQCLELLRKLEDKTLLCLEGAELVEEAFEKTGIRISFREGVDRIQDIGGRS